MNRHHWLFSPQLLMDHGGSVTTTERSTPIPCEKRINYFVRMIVFTFLGTLASFRRWIETADIGNSVFHVGIERRQRSRVSPKSIA